MDNPLSVDLQDFRCESSDRNTGPLHKHEYITTRYVWIQNTHVWRPPTDVYETGQAIRVQVEVAGMEHADIAVTIEGKILRITGNRKDHQERRVYHQMEIHTGEFLTEIELPVAVESDYIRARYHDGFLLVDLRKIQETPGSI
ncbi:MAG: Hsp20/alpha crystallin family protein [Anaerolineales bacterium]|nr:Hsp20/alpha crystallin family protein [Anaerolineales bacterium]